MEMFLNITSFYDYSFCMILETELHAAVSKRECIIIAAS